MNIPGDTSDRVAVDAPARHAGSMATPNLEPTPGQLLCAAVISRAMQDATGGAAARRRHARQWLLASSDLEFWCHLGGLSLTAVRQRAADALGVDGAALDAGSRPAQHGDEREGMRSDGVDAQLERVARGIV